MQQLSEPVGLASSSLLTEAEPAAGCAAGLLAFRATTRSTERETETS